MRMLICSWCSPPRIIRKGTLPASHGICPACAAMLLAEAITIPAVEQRIEEAERHQ